MGIIRKCYVNASAKTDCLPITFEVKKAVAESGCAFGCVQVFSAHATTALVILENDPKICDEYKNLLEKLVPESAEKRPARRSGSGKNSAHLRAALVGNSLSLPIAESKLQLGAWQEIMVVDCDDKVCRREILIVVSGESVAAGGK
ncbi:MAG: YjbQ family protein [Deltaproteobacteria bacterium]|nr:YjbQ family protein [Deltaproteobacteria bacterium]